MVDARWEAVRKITLARDGYKCLLCFDEATDVHHRVLKGMGGTSNEEIKYGLANLISLCRTDHTWVHGHVEDARRLGFIVPSWKDPATVPLTVRPGTFWVKLDKQGDMEIVQPQLLF